MTTTTPERGKHRLQLPMSADPVRAPKSLEPFFKDPQYWGRGDDARWYQHQIVGVRTMISKNSLLVADDMGLGKTMQVLAAFAADVKRDFSTRMVVVCPGALKSNWENEIDQFTRIPSVVIRGTNAEQRWECFHRFQKLEGPKILVLNYEQVPDFLTELNALRFDVAAFDEAHMLKNPDSVRTSACRNLYSRRTFMITGSPMLNDVCDLWVPLDRVSGGRFDTYKKFRNLYAVFGEHRGSTRQGGKGGKPIVGVKNWERLRTRMSQLVLQRKKEDVLDLPTVRYVTRLAEMHPTQRRLYRRLEKELLAEYADGTTEDMKELAGVRFGKMLMLCGTTAAYDEALGDHSDKLDVAVDDAVQLIKSGEPVVVFTRYRMVQAAFVARLEKALPGRTTYVINGDTPVDHTPSKPSRQQIVDAWTADEQACAIVCTYQSAGVGLNMVRSKNCLRLDKLFVPMLNKQAVDRLNRIGADTKNPITVWDYAVVNSVDQRVSKILANKERDIDKVMGTGGDTAEMMLDAVMAEEFERGTA